MITIGIVINDFGRSDIVNNQMEEVLLKYQFAKEILETELKMLLREYEYVNGYNPVEHVKSRIKSMDSIEKKLKNKGYELN